MNDGATFFLALRNSTSSSSGGGGGRVISPAIRIQLGLGDTKRAVNV